MPPFTIYRDLYNSGAYITTFLNSNKGWLSISPKKDSYEQSGIVEEICFYKTVAKQDFGEIQFLRTLQWER